MEDEMNILKLFSHSQPGICDQFGVMKIDNIIKVLKKYLKKVDIIRLDLCGNPNDKFNDDWRCVPWTIDSDQKFALLYLNISWMANLHKILSAIKEMKIKLPVIIKLFNSSNDYVVWKYNSNHVHGFDDPRLFYWHKAKKHYTGLVKEYIDFIIKATMLYDIDIYFDISENKDTGLYHRVFNYMTTI